MRLVHEQVRPHQCSSCSPSFGTVFNLKRHEELCRNWSPQVRNAYFECYQQFVRRFGKLHATLPPQPPIANIVDSSSLRLIPKEKLTKSQEQLLKAKLPDDQPGEQVVCVLFGVKLTLNEFRTLDSEQWLNDEIANTYCQLLLACYSEAQVNEIHVFSSFFYSTLVKPKSGYRHHDVAKWTANVDIFSKRFVFFPMNDNNHWTLAVADIRIKTLLYFDSLSRAR